MRGPSPVVYREEERHRALGRDATFSWSRALTHPPRCNLTRHRNCNLVSDFVGAAILYLASSGRHLGSHASGAAILDRKSWGPPSWIGSDVKNAKVTPILHVLLSLSLSLCLSLPEKYKKRDSFSNHARPYDVNISSAS